MEPPLAFRGPASSASDIFAMAFALAPGGGVRSLFAVLSCDGPSAIGAETAAVGAPPSTAAAVVAVSSVRTVVSPPASPATGLGALLEL